MSEIKWWGYLHTSGTIQVKRYFDPRDIQEAQESPFCQKVVGPFPAEGREDAIKRTEALLEPPETDPDWDGKCENCGQSPTVPATGMCGPCTFGEADTAGGNW